MKQFCCFTVLVCLLAVGCSTRPHWPAPKETDDFTLQAAHRTVLVSMVLGDALHLLVPPPSAVGTQWQVLVANGRALRQMTGIEPVPGRPGWSQISYQAIHIVGRTQLKLAALPPNAQGYEPRDVFTLAINIKHRGE